MKYLDWNKALYDYFFNNRDGGPVVLACNERVLKAIQSDSVDESDDNDEEENVDENEQEPLLNELVKKIKQLDHIWAECSALQGDLTPKTRPLKKALLLQEKKVTSVGEAPPYLAILCVLSAVAYDEETTEATEGRYAVRLNRLFGERIAQDIDRVHNLYECLEKSHPSFHSFNVHGAKHVGRIYSQTPLTKADELTLKIWLVNRVADEHSDEDERYQDVYQYLDDMLARFDSRTQRYWRNFSELERDIMVRYVLRHWDGLIAEHNENPNEVSEQIERIDGENKKTLKVSCSHFIEYANGAATRRTAILIPTAKRSLPDSGSLVFKRRGGTDELVPFWYRTVDRPGKKDLDLFEEFRFIGIEGNLDSGKKYECHDRGISFVYSDCPQFPLFLSPMKNSGKKLLMINDGDSVTQDDFVISDVLLQDLALLVSRGTITLDGESQWLYKVSPAATNDDEILGKKIERIERQLKVVVTGVRSHGSKGQKMASGFPVELRVEGDSVDTVEVLDTSESPVHRWSKQGFEDEFDFRREISGLSNGFYRVVLRDVNGNQLRLANMKSLEFEIFTPEDDFRLAIGEPMECFRLNEDDKAEGRTISIDESTVFDFDIQRDKIAVIEDVAIRMSGLASTAKTALRELVIPHILSEEVDSCSKKHALPAEDLTFEICKLVFRVFEEMGIAERRGSQAYRMVKPYWHPSSVRGQFHLVGALTSDERTAFRAMTNVKPIEQSVERFFRLQGKWVGCRIDLPTSFVCLTSNERTLPSIGMTPIRTKAINYAAVLPYESSLPEGNLVPEQLANGDGLYPVNFRNSLTHKLERFNWRTAEWMTVKANEDLNIWFEFAGKRLFRVTDQKSHNNYAEYHHFLFERTGNNPWRYKYYNAGQGRTACYDYLRSITHLDFTEYKPEGEFVLFRNWLTTLKKKISEANSMSDMTDHVNDVVSIDLLARVLKKSLFIYDAEKRAFGCLTSMPLPRNVERALFLLSGKASFKREVQTVSVKDTVFKWQREKKVGDIVEGVREYRVYPDVPMRVAQEVASKFGDPAILAANPDYRPFYEVKI